MDRQMPKVKDNSLTPESFPETDNQSSQEKKSLIGSLLYDLLIAPTFFTSIAYINIIILYVCGVLLLSGHEINLWYGIIYIPLLYLVYFLRKLQKEKERREIAHSIPFFAEALANALSVGGTLEDAIQLAALLLKGKIKNKFNETLLKHSLGENLDTLLRELDSQFPNTGLMYLIFLLNSYSELGVGISPLLKRIVVSLKQKEKDEEKIRTILAEGSTYAWLTITIFSVIFAALGFLLQDQLKYLLSDELRYVFIFLVLWSFAGIIIVTRLTSLEYSRTSSMKPYLKRFFSKRKLSSEEVLKYSAVNWASPIMRLVEFIPLFSALFCAYMTTYYSQSFFAILAGFVVGYLFAKVFLSFIVNGIVADQLIKTIEIFPEMLQIFNIGLCTGLNNYLSYQFALNAIQNDCPKILGEELRRTKLALECGEEQTKTWQRLSQRLPFESIEDFAEIMSSAPLHGESIIESIVETTKSYQEKKMLSIERTATKTSQLVIPIIILAFFPLFVFFVFAPTLTKISNLVSH
jgi:Flp pilus assembly protein TadB